MPRILFVDDVDAILEICKEYFQRKNYEVALASDGFSAQETYIKEMSSRGIDVVVTNINMPGLNGIEFMEWVKERNPAMPFVIYSGMASELDGCASWQKYMKTVPALEKPCNLTELEDAVQSVLYQKFWN